VRERERKRERSRQSIDGQRERLLAAHFIYMVCVV
jgi:hypothetical protein